MMSRLLSLLAVAALVGAAQPAAAAPAVADDDAAWLGVLQQGKGQGGGGNQGGGGGQEARGGGRGQGGGGQEARESRGRSSGGSEARQSGQGQSARGSSEGAQGSGGSARGSGSSGRGSGGSAEEKGKGNSSGGAARSERGNSGGNSGSVRSERGNSGGNASVRSEGRGANASATGTERRNANATADRPTGASGRGNGPRDLQARIDALPAAQRRMATSSRASERMVAGAIARGHARGLRADAFDVRSDNGRVRIQNRRGDVLFDMDDRRAGELGGWPLRRLGDQSPRANAPAFCRSGQGHPVRGREWCIDKGFGLGSRQGTLWSRGGIGDVIFRQPDYRTRLDRGGLIGVLGDIVLGRLALQSVALGYDEPLTGYWVADPSGPYILRVRSGDNDVAEFYDADRNNRVDVLYVVQPVW
jgi:hypothetical protein